MKGSSFFLPGIILFTLIFQSCYRVIDKGKGIFDASKEKSEDLIDKVHPQFDAYKADTKYNKLRFADFIKIPLTDDIKNIYCHDDAIGIDADYQFGFNCNAESAKKIIKKHQMTIQTENRDFSTGLQTEFDWWKIEKMKTLDLYTWKSEDESYFKYFWYDRTEQKAYFFDFDM